MANNENLKHFTSDQSHDEAVRNGRKGGVASGKARRDRRRMVEYLECALQADHYDLDGNCMSKAAAMAAALVERAVDGDVSAARLIFGYTDGLPVVRAEIEAPIPDEVRERVARVLEG